MTLPRADVVVAGHVCVDLVPALHGPPCTEPGRLAEVGPLTLRTGGCLGNTGRDLRDLGATVRVVTTLGDDALGAVAAAVLRSEHPGRLDALVVPGATTSYSVVVDPPGVDRTFWHHVGANASFDGSGVDVAAARLLHVGYLPLLPALAAGSGARLLALLQRARAAGAATSVDSCVVDPAAEPARVDWAHLLERCLPLVDLASPSLDDLTSALGTARAPVGAPQLRTAADGAAWLVERGAAVAVVTDGARGLSVRTAGPDRFGAAPLLRELPTSWHGRSVDRASAATSVVQTTGAGDAVSAGLLRAVVAGLGLEEALDLVVRSAAHRVAGLGALADLALPRGTPEAPAHPTSTRAPAPHPTGGPR